MSAWQPARARGPLLVLACLLGGLALLDGATSVATGWDVFGGSEQSQSFGRLELASAKALALAAAGRSNTRVGLVVGMSTADWGIDLRQLEVGQEGLRWAKVTGEFSSFTNLLDIARRFERARVEPTRTLLCVHYGMLLGARRYKGTRAERLSQIVARFGKSHSRSELSRLITLSWLGNNRIGSANALELRLGRARESILGAFGEPDELAYPSISNPFDDSVYAHEPMLPTVRARHVEGFDAAWRLAQAHPATEDERRQAHALTQVAELLGRRPGFVVVLMPEHSALRAVVPAHFARGMLDEALAAARVTQPVRVLDLRAALPDQYFADEVHATAEGRTQLTTVLSRALATTSPNR